MLQRASFISLHQTWRSWQIFKDSFWISDGISDAKLVKRSANPLYIKEKGHIAKK
jgi:hypothetical protein